MGGFPSTARIKIRLPQDHSTAIIVAYDYVSYLESHPPGPMDAKRGKLVVPVVLDEVYLGMPVGTHCWLLDCPHCGGSVLVARNEVNCAVFRHGAFKDGSGQIPPHASKPIVDALLESKAVWGCGQPFLINVGLGTVHKADWNDQPVMSNSDSTETVTCSASDCTASKTQ